MFRVFDYQEKCWVDSDVYLSANNEIIMAKKSVFGAIKSLLVLPQDRYIYHRSINLLDKNQVQVYEGDYIKAQVSEDKSVIGLVHYAHELSAYVILCVDSDEFYTLGSEVCEHIEVVGNVFDGY